jgi:DNA polymerase sigma|tara:strand:- start:877 stop:978 length:102 start_codon:yes stop_codon:yes gene_type:complete
MSNTNLDEKIKTAEARIKELELLIKHWREANKK